MLSLSTNTVCLKKQKQKKKKKKKHEISYNCFGSEEVRKIVQNSTFNMKKIWISI